MTHAFCDDRLGVFLDQLTGMNTPEQSQPEEVNALTLAPLPQTAHAEFLAAFKRSIQHTFVDFLDLLDYDAALLEFTETTHDAVMGDLALPAMLSAAEQRFTELLTSINQRLALITGCAIELGTNPLAPVHFALALETAAQNLFWNLHTRVVALKVFDAEFLHHLGVLYADIDQYLGGESNLAPAVDESTVDVLAVTDGYGEDSGAAANLLRANQVEPEIVLQSEPEPEFELDPDLERQLEAATTAALPLASDVAVPSVDPAAPAVANEAVASTTAQPVDYVNYLFSGFLDKRSLSEHLVNLFSDLYLPYVQLASDDSSFADADQHPAKHLLNGLAKACKIYQEEADDLQKSALVLEMKAVVRRITEADQPNRETFADAAFRFSASLRQHERQVARRVKNLRLQRSGLRHLDGWKQHVSHVIRSKLTQHPQPVPEAVRLFLAGPWMNYMADQYLNAATHNVQPTQTLALVDEILTYVAPTSLDDVLEFTTIGTPVRQSLVACKIDEREIKQFLLQLMHFHRLAVRSLETEVAFAE